MELDFAKELYREEWARRDELASGIGTPVAVLTAIGGAVVLLVKDYDFSGDLGTRVFAGAVGNAIFFLSAAAYFLSRSYHGYLYEQLPSAQQLRDYYLQLRNYYEHPDVDGPGLKTDFDTYLIERYIDASEKNSANNTSKAAYLYRANQSIIVGMLVSALAVLPWSVQMLSRSASTQDSCVTHPLRVHISGGNPLSDPKSSSASSTEKKPAPPKPIGPPNRPIREGEQPRKNTTVPPRRSS